MTRQDISRIPGARKAALPNLVAPQLATLVKEPPTGDEWLHELKFDGYRMLCRVDRGKVQFWSRNGIDWTKKFPNVVEAVKLLPITTGFLDGEIVVIDAKGRSSFQKLQRAMGSVTSRFVYEVFDLIYVDGFDITRTPLVQRKMVLKHLYSSMPRRSVLRYSEYFQGNGNAFFKHACNSGFEGMVSKLAESHYVSGRTRNWLKVKCAKQQEFVIVGYTPSSKGLPGFGSLILGVYDTGKLVYAGRVGTGFTFKQRSELKKQLDKLKRATSPLAVVPKDPRLREALWVEPKFVAEVAFTEWTSDGSIRHPSFQGLREDKKPKEVVREVPKAPHTRPGTRR